MVQLRVKTRSARFSGVDRSFALASFPRVMLRTSVFALLYTGNCARALVCPRNSKHAGGGVAHRVFASRPFLETGCVAAASVIKATVDGVHENSKSEGYPGFSRSLTALFRARAQARWMIITPLSSTRTGENPQSVEACIQRGHNSLNCNYAPHPRACRQRSLCTSVLQLRTNCFNIMKAQI